MNISVKILAISSCVVLGGAFSLGSIATGQSYEDYFAQYGVEVAPEAGAEYAYPERAKPDVEQKNTDLSYRVHDVLPFDQDKNASLYMVLPKAGIVFPIVLPSGSDKEKIQAGEMFDHFGYLTKGALRYYGQKNKVVAVHSSYKKSDSGRYKTVGQGLIILRPSDKVFFYYKNKQGTYDFAEYTVKKSEETDPSDISITKQDSSQFMLTAYSCYPVGSSSGRRYVQATLSKEIEDHSTLIEPQADSIPEKEEPEVEAILPTPTTTPVPEQPQSERPTEIVDLPAAPETETVEIIAEPTPVVLKETEPTPIPPAPEMNVVEPENTEPTETTTDSEEHGSAEPEESPVAPTTEATTDSQPLFVSATQTERIIPAVPSETTSPSVALQRIRHMMVLKAFHAYQKSLVQKNAPLQSSLAYIQTFHHLLRFFAPVEIHKQQKPTSLFSLLLGD